jgi:hypothetical protein
MSEGCSCSVVIAFAPARGTTDDFRAVCGRFLRVCSVGQDSLRIILMNMRRWLTRISPACSRDVRSPLRKFSLIGGLAAEGNKGRQFYTPQTIVRLLVEILTPYKRRVDDPCGGTGRTCRQAAAPLWQNLQTETTAATGIMCFQIVLSLRL